MENRNLQWNKRVKVPLILIFSVNTNHESVAYRSFRPSKFEARGARKVTTGMEAHHTSQGSLDPRALVHSADTALRPCGRHTWMRGTLATLTVPSGWVTPTPFPR